jgi:glycerate kinase
VAPPNSSHRPGALADRVVTVPLTTAPLTTAPLTVVIAPDSFKGSVSARNVSVAIAAGWAEIRPNDTLILLPQADGGEGTIDAVEAAVAGSMRHHTGMVRGPDGRPTAGMWLELPGGVAVVELAQMSGLPLMHTLDPLHASTFGLGEVIRDALDAGVRSLVIGLGGSASTDGAAGALTALGMTLRNDVGEPVTAGGAGLAELANIDSTGLLAPPIDGVTVLTDVAAPLTGPTGAAWVFGPQKGADSGQIALLDTALARFADLLGGDPQQAGAGAAGGAGYGFAAAWGAAIEPGAAYIATLSGLTAAIVSADVIITGEGRFDATSSTGKVVGEAISLTSAHGVLVGVIAGQVTATPVAATGDTIWSAALADLAGSVQSAMNEPESALREAGRAAAHHFGEWASKNA